MTLCLKRPLWFALFVFSALFLMLTLGEKANATSITLERSDMRVCEVQVTIGPDAPNGHIYRFADMSRDDRYTFQTNKLCIRRTIGEEACLDDYTDWSCCEAQAGQDITCRVP